MLPRFGRSLREYLPLRRRVGNRCELAVSRYTELSQSDQQVLDWTFTHALDAVELKFVHALRRHQRGEKSHSGAGVAHE